VESSVDEQADAGAVAVCGGAGAAGADGESECIAWTFVDDTCEGDERASDACDASSLASEDEYDAQTWKHGPVESFTQYFCNERRRAGTGYEAGHPEVKEGMHQKRCLLFHCTERNPVATIRARAACVS
jgi:hypothetical protein